MDFSTDSALDDGTIERRFHLDDIPGILWMPGRADSAHPVPLLLLGHPGGLDRMYPRLRARAQHAAVQGFAAVTIEVPGSGERSPSPATAQARADMRAAVTAGMLPTDEVIDRFILPLVAEAVPEWRRVMDELLVLPTIGERVGISGGVIAVATRLAAIDARIAATGVFAGSFIPRQIIEEARSVTVPVHMLLQWDDEGNDRQRALDLFDAFGSPTKTLEANMGGAHGGSGVRGRRRRPLLRPASAGELSFSAHRIAARAQATDRPPSGPVAELHGFNADA